MFPRQFAPQALKEGFDRRSHPPVEQELVKEPFQVKHEGDETRRRVRRFQLSFLYMCEFILTPTPPLPQDECMVSQDQYFSLPVLALYFWQRGLDQRSRTAFTGV